MQSEFARSYNDVVNRTTATLWERRVLPLETMALVNLGILACLNRPRELYIRCVGLLQGGISVEEITEVILQVGFYAGNPAGVEALAALDSAINELRSRQIPYNVRAHENNVTGHSPSDHGPGID
jgi:alkylhydroperoxidase/carboxymuconolactone decarboxylase family protein YurZ